MRKVSETIARAFAEGRPASSGNTTTDGSVVLLHGNRIAWRQDGTIYATLAGWSTVTTRERINSLARALGSSVSVYQDDFQPMYSASPTAKSKPISNVDVFVIGPDPLTAR